MPQPAFKQSKRILVISPGIEDNGMRGLGYVTFALIDGLSKAGHDVMLLTGAPIDKTKSSNMAINAAAMRRYLDHYLLDGYRSSAYRLDQKKVFRFVVRDTLRLLLGKVTYLSRRHVVEVRHQPQSLRRFNKLYAFVNFAFVYRFAAMLPARAGSSLLYMIANSVGADVIITASPYPLAQPVLRSIKRPHIVQYVHDVMPLHILETPPDAVPGFAVNIEQSLANADIVLTSSRNAKDKIQQLFPNLPCKVAYLPCEPAGIRRNNKINIASLIKVKKNKYFLFMSTVEERKNVTRLIQAFSLLKGYSGYKLVIIGSKGYGWAEVEAQLNALHPKVRERIIFTGYVSEEDKWSLIDRSLAVVHPSIDEGLGIPVIEAIVAAKPIVATRLPSVEEIAPPGCVTYIEDPYDIYEMANKLEYCIVSANDQEEILKTGSRMLQERFSSDRFVQRLTNVLAKL